MNLVFLDVETTGLREDKDMILELGMVAVELPTFEVVAEWSRVIRPPLWESVKRNLHEKVLEMHTRSGLVADIDDSETAPEHLIEGEACAFVQQYAPHTPAWQTRLAGANPDFDRRFLRKRMPKLHAKFHYRNFDVRSITELQDWVFGVAHVDSPHRALLDCLHAIQQVRDFIGAK